MSVIYVQNAEACGTEPIQEKHYAAAVAACSTSVYRTVPGRGIRKRVCLTAVHSLSLVEPPWKGTDSAETNPSD